MLRVLFPGSQTLYRLYRVTGEELARILQALEEYIRLDQPDVIDIDSLSNDDFKLVSPITKEPFGHLVNSCHDGGRTRNVERKDLLMFLWNLGQGLSDSFRKLIFNYSSR